LGDEPAIFFAKLKDYASESMGEAGYQKALKWLEAENFNYSAPSLKALPLCKNRKPNLFDLCQSIR
jgi:hypothetical protein